MKILALDTSTEFCSVALVIGDVTAVRELRAGQSHSSLLLRMIDEVLKERGVRLEDLDAIAFGEGPGSFTGLRIACGVVQGLAFGADVPVLGVSTLLAMAFGTRADKVVCCVDARVEEIYHAAYRYDAHGDVWQTIHAPRVCAPGAAPELEGGDWLACGSGFSAYGEVLESRYSGQLVAVEPLRFPHARDIAALAMPRVARGEAGPADGAAPVYLRDKVALRIDERAKP